MICQLEFVRQDGDRYIHRCRKCKAEARSKYADPAMRKQKCGTAGPPPPEHGPGTEFFTLTKELGVLEKPGCKCPALRQEMNTLGVEGCRRERARLLAALDASLKHYTFTEKGRAAFQALAKGLPLSLGGMLDLAIQRAESRTSPEAP